MENVKAGPLYKMFSSVPRRYDLMNRVLTLGLDESWRRKAARICLEESPGTILDLCTGTGDLALHLVRRAGNGQEVYAADFSESMLDVARRKALHMNITDITFIRADAASLPFEDGFFGAIGIAFAFRNLTFRNPLTARFLAEIYRVLKPGGRCVIVETCQPDSRILKGLFHLYLDTVVAGPVAFLSGHNEAYRYLAYSARNYYPAIEVVGLMKDNGFSKAEVRKLLGGIIAIYTFRK